jgi:hypothetical protein
MSKARPPGDALLRRDDARSLAGPVDTRGVALHPSSTLTLPGAQR